MSKGKLKKDFDSILTKEALQFVSDLHLEFNAERIRLLQERDARQLLWDAGSGGKFLMETAHIRDADWDAIVAQGWQPNKDVPLKEDMLYRPVEITGPAQDAKIMINALNSARLIDREDGEWKEGTSHFMADLEDSAGETWDALIQGQINLKQAVDGTITYFDTNQNKEYKLRDLIATLLVRPRGLHLEDKHFQVEGQNVSASLIDFGLYLFHNHKALTEKGTAPYYYIPKLQSYKEVMWWNQVLTRSEEMLGLPVGTIKVTPLLETLALTYQVEETIWALKDHIAGINAGRWDYQFDYIKKLRNHYRHVLPDRQLVTMEVTFMKAYVLNLIRACHKWGIHAMGGMSAFIPVASQLSYQTVIPGLDSKVATKVWKVLHLEGSYFDDIGNVTEKFNPDHPILDVDLSPLANEIAKSNGMTIDQVLEEITKLMKNSLHDRDLNKMAMEKVKQDKELEFIVRGHDGTWIAHPGLAIQTRKIADAAFKKQGDGKNQFSRQLTYTDVIKEIDSSAKPKNGKEFDRKEYETFMEKALIEAPKSNNPKNTKEKFEITEAGIRFNASVGIEYLAHWLRGKGAKAINNLMEDLATAEISRTQLWQWIWQAVKTDQGVRVTSQNVRQMLKEELAVLIKKHPQDEGVLNVAEQLFAISVTNENLDRFIPEFVYDFLDKIDKIISRMQEDKEPLQNPKEIQALREAWAKDPRWAGIKRNYTPHQVLMLHGEISIEYTRACHAAEKLWKLTRNGQWVRTFGFVNGNQAMQAVKAGLEAGYVSGWQTAAANNRDLSVFPDQSIYQANSVPDVVREINNALKAQEQIHHIEGTRPDIDWVVPLVADAEAGFGGTNNAFELMKSMIRAGAAGVHFEDQVAAEKKCGHLGGKVLVPTSYFIRTLNTARIAADVMKTPTILIARTDADSAQLLMSDIDPYDKALMIGSTKGLSYEEIKAFINRSEIKAAGGAKSDAAFKKGIMTFDIAEKKGLLDLTKKWKPARDPDKGYFLVHGGVEGSIRRAIAYAPYADLIWMETSHPSVAEFKEFTEGVRGYSPDGGKSHPFKDKKFAYNCSPSFNWRSKLSDKEIASFQEDLAALGAVYQFITLAGIHGLWHQSFQFARVYKDQGMKAYVEKVQEPEFASEEQGYTGDRHQREVRTGYYDKLTQFLSGGKSQTKALEGSTESDQFYEKKKKDEEPPPLAKSA